MAQSANINVQRREKVGSRDARALRANGRIPANLQSKDAPHVDFSLDEREFLATRRAHVHLYDLEFGDASEAAVVRELQWDAFGERILHVEFKRVQRGVATESEVELAFTGTPKGVVNHLVHHISIRCIPSLIPDSIEVNVHQLEIGTVVEARDLALPEGIELDMDPGTVIASIVSSEPTEVEEEPAAAEGLLGEGEGEKPGAEGSEEESED